jgi:hypothetical protein
MKYVQEGGITLLATPDKVNPSGQIFADVVTLQRLGNCQYCQSRVRITITRRCRTMNKRGSFFAHGGRTTWCMRSPLFCWTPKSRLAEFSKNLSRSLSSSACYIDFINLLWTCEKFRDKLPNISSDVLRC